MPMETARREVRGFFVILRSECLDTFSFLDLSSLSFFLQGLARVAAIMANGGSLQGNNVFSCPGQLNR